MVWNRDTVPNSGLNHPMVMDGNLMTTSLFPWLQSSCLHLMRYYVWWCTYVKSTCLTNQCSCWKVGLKCTDLQLFWRIWEHRRWSWRGCRWLWWQRRTWENDVDYIQWWVTTMMNNCQRIKTVSNSTWELHSFLHRYTVMTATHLLEFPYRSIRSLWM